MPIVQATRERNILKLQAMTDRELNGNCGWGWVDVEAELLMDVQQLPKRIKQVRIHDSGDFYSFEYFYTWCRVADACRDLVFYGYTKQIEWYQRLLKDRKIPHNMYIAQSVGGKEDYLIDPYLPHSRIFPTIDELKDNGYTDCTHTDVPVYQGVHRIGLVYHGSRNLTDGQANTLRNIDIGV